MKINYIVHRLEGGRYQIVAWWRDGAGEVHQQFDRPREGGVSYEEIVAIHRHEMGDQPLGKIQFA